MQEKMLPFDIHAEKGFLSILLFYPETLVEVAGLIEETDFYRADHASIFAALSALDARKQAIDVHMLSLELARRGIEQIGEESTRAFLSDLQDYEPLSSKLQTYADRVMFLAELRHLIGSLTTVVGMALEQDPATLERAEQAILERKRRVRATDIVSLSEYMTPYLKHLDELHSSEKTRGIPTGIGELDRILGGFQQGKLYVPAARPGVGKSSICQNFAYTAAARYDKKVALFSLEMSLDDLADGFLSLHKRVDGSHLSNGCLTDSEWDKVVASTNDFEELGLYLSYCPGITVTQLGSMARRAVARYGVEMVIIDYLQMLKATNSEGKRIIPRYEEVAEVARELKLLAGMLKVPIIAPAQINRELDKRAATRDEDGRYSYKMPVFADLRESGEIEQSADVLLFMTCAEEDSSRVKMDIAKNRKGQTGELDLLFVGSQKRFCSLSSMEVRV